MAASYNFTPTFTNAGYFFNEVGKSLDKYSQLYSNYLLIGDINAEESEPVLAKSYTVIIQLI